MTSAYLVFARSRFSIVFIIALTTGCATPAEEMRPVYEAAKRVKAALDVDVSESRFSELRIDLTTELRLKQDELRFDAVKAQRLKRHIEAYAGLLKDYNLYAEVWGARIDYEDCLRGLPETKCASIYNSSFTKLNSKLKAADLSGDLFSLNPLLQVRASISSNHLEADWALNGSR